MFAVVPDSLIVPALKRGILPLYTAADFSWPWLKDDVWVESKSEQEALWAAYNALPAIAKAVLGFEAFVAKATPEQVAAGRRLASTQGLQAAGLVLPSQAACIRFFPSFEQLDWHANVVALSLSPQWLTSSANGLLAPVQYASHASSKFIGWQQMPSIFARQKEVRWLARQSDCLAHSQRYWLKLSKQAIAQITVHDGSQVAVDLLQLIKMDQRYRHIPIQRVQFNTKSFAYQLC